MLAAEKACLCNKFDMVDQGEAHSVLGMLINRDRATKTLFISKPNYLENILKKFGMENCKPVSTPVEAGKKFHKIIKDEKSFSLQLYQQAIGNLCFYSHKA